MDYSFLTSTDLFSGVKEDEIKEMLSCLSVHEKKYKKDAVICRAGEAVTEVGLVQSGSVNIVANFYWGSSNIFSHVEKGQIFAENYAAAKDCGLTCDVVAAEDTSVLFLDMDRLLTTCAKGCAFHNKTIHNLLRISARKNLELSARMMHIAPKSIRGRLLSYLSEQAVKNGGSSFRIPFSRQQLADYLSVDRSALSGELSKMQKDGLISYHKNEFVLSDKARMYV